MTTLEAPPTRYESQSAHEAGLDQNLCTVVRRIVDRSGKTVQVDTPLQSVSRADAGAFITAQQAVFKRHGTNEEFGYSWAANPSAPGCSASRVTRWTIER